MSDEQYKPGALCVINGLGDLYMEYEARPFIDKQCTVVKRTKGGLIEVELDGKRYSFAQRNVDLCQ